MPAVWWRMRWMLITVVCVAGCGLIPEGVSNPVSGAVSPSETGALEAGPEEGGITPVRPQPRPEGLAINPDDVAAVAEPSAPEVSVGTLGRTVASLGNAAEPGVWLKTPLVTATRPGRVFFPETGKTIDVTLIPIDGPDTAGSRMSLAAMQGVGASLTDLIEVDVLAG